jgi:hypothetical protein
MERGHHALAGASVEPGRHHEDHGESLRRDLLPRGRRHSGRDGGARAGERLPALQRRAVPGGQAGSHRNGRDHRSDVRAAILLPAAVNAPPCRLRVPAAVNIRNRVARGDFSVVLFVQRHRTIGWQTVRLD